MRRSILARLFVLAIVWSSPALGAPIGYQVVTLVSSASDADLINPWGLASSSAGPFWVGANGTGKGLIYDSNGVRNPNLTVAIPGDGSVTGVVFNTAGGFNDDLFLFASEDGTVSGWRGALGSNAERLVVGDPAHVYKGLDVASVNTLPYAYLADFASGSVDVLKGAQNAPDLTGKFTDPNLPAGYAPFNVATLDGFVYVTYAALDPLTHDDVPGAGHGFVNKFDLQGNLVQRLVTAGALNSPWGLALAPAGFGDLAGALLVGNFGDGRINAYDPLTGLFLQTLLDANFDPLTIDGLWALRFGNGGNGGAPGTLYFTAGPNGEQGGQFGALMATETSGTSTTGTTTSGEVPEPASVVLLVAGLIGVARRRLREQSSDPGPRTKY
jgi:uncharacterized protein (TIGR03118 family)